MIVGRTRKRCRYDPAGNGWLGRPLMDLSTMTRSALEQHARDLHRALVACEGERIALLAALRDIEVLAREASETMYAAAELARMVRTNQTEREDVA